MYYVAYGSNMNLPQMAKRCPKAILLGPSYLHGYRLRFRGGENSAVATVEPYTRRSRVPVLVWQISPEDEKTLDIYEGWPRLYRKELVNICIDRKWHKAMIYIMNEDRYPYNLPSKSYFDSIRDGYITADFDPQLLVNAVSNN